MYVYIRTYFYIQMCPQAIDTRQGYTGDVHYSSHYCECHCSSAFPPPVFIEHIQLNR